MKKYCHLQAKNFNIFATMKHAFSAKRGSSRQIGVNSYQFGFAKPEFGKSQYLSSGAKDSKPLWYINTYINE